MKAQGEPAITVRTWAKVLVFGGVTAAALMVLLGVIFPFLVLDPPHGLGIHPFLAHNPGSSPGKDDTYGRIVAGVLAWLGGTYAGIRTAGIHGRRERRLAALSLAGVVAILFVANVLTDAAQAREGETAAGAGSCRRWWASERRCVCAGTTSSSRTVTRALSRTTCVCSTHSLPAIRPSWSSTALPTAIQPSRSSAFWRTRTSRSSSTAVPTTQPAGCGIRARRCRPASAPQIFERVGCDQPVDVR